MGQKILTEKEGTYLGRLSDIQFDTRRMHMEWMFPKKWWLTCTPIPKGLAPVTSAAPTTQPPATTVAGGFLFFCKTLYFNGR
jgi:hypothetical protein